MERTFIAVKPDGVQRGLCGEIIKRFEHRGFRLVAAKFVQASEDHMKKHYLDLKDMPFYAGLCKYMSSGPILAMVTHIQTHSARLQRRHHTHTFLALSLSIASLVSPSIHTLSCSRHRAPTSTGQTSRTQEALSMQALFSLTSHTFATKRG
uniref:Nucleoside diphosphate kinase B n=1 Tax=Neolamprologus brichardi TaxID=32507 RepID=A0A3Q4HQ85_NEOBR